MFRRRTDAPRIWDAPRIFTALCALTFADAGAGAAAAGVPIYDYLKTGYRGLKVLAVFDTKPDPVVIDAMIDARSHYEGDATGTDQSTGRAWGLMTVEAYEAITSRVPKRGEDWQFKNASKSTMPVFEQLCFFSYPDYAD